MHIMLKLRGLVLLFTAALTGVTNIVCAADTYPKRELRSVWMASLGIDWPVASGSKGSTTTAATKAKTECDKYLDLLKSYGYNSVYFHVRPYADRAYKLNTWTDPKTGTQYTVAEPFSAYVSGTRGTETTYDPLAYWIEAAHKRGMQLHAWVNPYRIINSPSNGTSQDQAVASWTFSQVVTDANGKNTTKTIFNPALPSTKARIQNVCRVLTGNYDIDGIVFDDYFYPEQMPTDNTAQDYTQYKAYADGGGTMNIKDWRREQVNDMVRKVYATIKEIKPWVQFGISPAGAASKGVKGADGIPPLSDYCKASDWQYDGIYSDPMAWMREKTIDYVSPQLYWQTTHTTNPYGPMAQWWGIAAQKFERPCYPSHSISFINGANNQTNWNEVSQQAQLNRQANLDGMTGFVTYSACNIDGSKNQGVGDVLHKDVYQYLSVPPAMTWYQATDPGMVTNLKNTSGTLKWDAKEGMRYIVYAVPTALNRLEATSDKGGLKAEYILEVPYTNSLSIPSAKQSGHWYAVSVLDRYNNEWSLATLNEPVTIDAEVSLTSPADGSEARLQQTFTWTGTAGGTFTFQLSASQDFGTVEITRSGTDLNSVTADLSGFRGNQRLYWRVSVEKSGCRSALSPARSIVTPYKEPFAAPALMYPADGSVLDNDAAFMVQDVNPDKTVLEISRDPEFGTVYYTASSGWKSTTTQWGEKVLTYNLPLMIFTQGTYYWRARAVKDTYDDGISDTWTFDVNNGTASSDYIPGRDPAEYATSTSGQNELMLTNLWMRNADINPLGADQERHRDMVARSAPDQDRDIVYVVGRSEASSSANVFLLRYDAATGQELTPLQITKDTSFPGTYYPGNGVLLDEANQLVVHNLALANGKIGLSVIDPSTGRATTVVTVNTPNRIDHLDVWGTVSKTGTFYILAPSAANIVTRWTVTDGTVTDTETMNITLGTAPTLYALARDRFWVDGSGCNPSLYEWGNPTALGVMNGTAVSPASTSPKGVMPFTHEGNHYLLYAHSYGTNSGKWSLASGKDFTEGVQNAVRHWTMPAQGIGIVTMVSSDYIMPVSMLQTDLGSAGKPGMKNINASANHQSTRLYTYSPGNGLGAYTLSHRIITGVDQNLTRTLDAPAVMPGHTLDFGGAPVNYTIYTLSGHIIEQSHGTASRNPLTPGLYIVALANDTGRRIDKVAISR